MANFGLKGSARGKGGLVPILGVLGVLFIILSHIAFLMSGKNVAHSVGNLIAIVFVLLALGAKRS